MEILKECWVDLFGCEAPVGLVKMNVKKVVKLLLAEAAARELV